MDTSLVLSIIAALSGVIYNRIVSSIKDVKKDLDSHQKNNDKSIADHEKRIQAVEITNLHKFENLEKKVDDVHQYMQEFIHKERDLYQQMKEVIMRINKNLPPSQ
jgi:hypothetical protein